MIWMNEGDTVCLCVCERERARFENERETKSVKITRAHNGYDRRTLIYHFFSVCPPVATANDQTNRQKTPVLAFLSFFSVFSI